MLRIARSETQPNCSRNAQHQEQKQQVQHNLTVVCAAGTVEPFGHNTRVLESSYLEYLGMSDSFPFKLHLMLTEMEEQGCGHIVSWQSHGRCFIVHQRKEFVNKIMPTFFRMSKYASFQRQLNIYGFNRITAGQDKGGYYHESFVRGRLDLSFEIQRQKVKGTCVRKPDAPEKEPNLYKLPCAPPSIPTKSTVWATPTLLSSKINEFDPVSLAAASHDATQDRSVASGHSLLSIISSKTEVLADAVMQRSTSLRPTVAVVNGRFGRHGVYQNNDQAMPRNFSFSVSPLEESKEDCYTTQFVPTQQRWTRQQQLLPQLSHQQSGLQELDNSFDALLTSLREMDDASVTTNPCASR